MCHLAQESNDPRVSPERIAFMVEHIFLFFANTLTYAQTLSDSLPSENLPSENLPSDNNSIVFDESNNLPQLFNRTDSSLTPTETPTSIEHMDLIQTHN